MPHQPRPAWRSRAAATRLARPGFVRDGAASAAAAFKTRGARADTPTQSPGFRAVGESSTTPRLEEARMNWSVAKKMLRKSPLHAPLRGLYRTIRRVPRHSLQKTKTKAGLNFRHFGTEYGGWVVEDAEYLRGCTILSAGLGEDASFDVEFARAYGATVMIVDPTPRAVEHYAQIMRHLGEKNGRGYSDGGKQPVEAYDLSGLSDNSLQLVQKALWNESRVVRFFEPSNPEHVSHSILRHQNHQSRDTAFIEVDAAPLTDVLRESGVDHRDVPLVKLDIEGAEIEVISDFLDKGFLPKQILVEFDELNVPSKESYARVDFIHHKLVGHGYECARTDGQADFLYLLSGRA